MVDLALAMLGVALVLIGANGPFLLGGALVGLGIFLIAKHGLGFRRSAR